MINQTTKDKIQALHHQYLNLAKGNESVLKEITLAKFRKWFITQTLSKIQPFH
jgi:hypothetical protein